MFAFLAGIDWGDVAEAGVDTVTMLGWALGFTVLIGLPLGVILYLTVGEAAKAFHGMINLMEMYEIEYEQAKKSLDTFLAKLREAGVLEE